MNLDAVVRHYRATFQASAQAELQSFRDEPLGDAVRRAALASRPNGLRYSHQTRLKPNHLADAATLLADRVDELRGAKSFAGLHALLKRLFGPLAGLGELYLYDTALRIGANLGMSPQAIYLHAGTRAGATALGLAVDGSTLLKSELPRALQPLRPHEIEDVLCIYKKHFAGKSDLDDAVACWVDDEVE